MSALSRSWILLAALLAISVSGPGPAFADTAEQTFEIAVPKATLTVSFTPDAFRLDRKHFLDWIADSANTVAIFYDRFPLNKTRVRLVPADGKGVKGGQAFGEGGGFIRVIVGRESDRQDLEKDWVMVHEMVHLAFPRLNRRHNWLAEGLAVYVESVARLQTGDLAPGFVWRGFALGMRNGLPEEGDRGLDHTPTWGRTYWGGALFCLVADIRIQERTGGTRTLRHALRAVLSAGGNYETHWPIEKALALGDAATGTTVLMDLYEAWRATPVAPDLTELWQQLGVEVVGRTARFDDTATLAPIRKRIGERQEPARRQ